MVTIRKYKLVLMSDVIGGLHSMILYCDITGVHCVNSISVGKPGSLRLHRFRYNIMKDQIMKLRAKEDLANEVS